MKKDCKNVDVIDDSCISQSDHHLSLENPYGVASEEKEHRHRSAYFEGNEHSKYK